MSGSGQRFVVVGGLRVSVIKGDIAQQQVDVIVNSNSSDLDLSKSRASQALLNAAGPGIQAECEENYHHGIEDGEIAVTSGGQLSCKAIYHGALSPYSGPDDEQKLERIVHSSLDQAETDGFVTIAFPALGTGYYKYPPARVAEIMFSCIKQVTPQSLKEVRIIIFTTDNSNFRIFLNEAKKYSVSRSGSTQNPQDCIKIGNVNVKVMVGELSKVKAGVIVCSGPTDLQLSNKGLSQSLLDVSGPEMQEELNQKSPNGIDYGDFAVSKGYNLKCRFVYHGALPKWGTNNPDPCDTMEEFVDSCLEEANQYSTRTIAFPTLGVGSLKYPVEESARIMGECVRYFCTSQMQINIKTIIIVVYSGCKNHADIKEEFIKELTGGPSLLTGGLSVFGAQAQVAVPAQNIVSRHSLSKQFGNISVTLVIGNLAEQQVDVIVNSISSDLSMSFGMAAAISAAAGLCLADELEQTFPMGINEGDIAATEGHNLHCKEVYNGHLLPWYSKRSTGAKPPDLVLGDFVFACLEKANVCGHSSIAFPTLGTGYHKFPVDAAAESMVASIVKFSCQQNRQMLSDVRIVLYGGSSDLSGLEKEFKREISQGDCRGMTTLIQSLRLGMSPAPTKGTRQYLQFKCGETIKAPPYWTRFTSKKTLKEWNQAVKSGDVHSQNIDQSTYACIQSAFGNTFGNATIVKIQRIENADLFLKYGEERQRLFRKVNSEGQFKRPDQIPGSHGPVKVMGFLNPSMTNHTESEVNEYYFFHATKPQFVDIICKQGLDSRIANAKGRLGSGVYGAEEACKSHQYAGCDKQQCFPMFLVRMSLGDIFMTQKENSFKRPPCKVCTTQVCINHQELHDSVMANGGNFQHREFVVYDRYQSYPEYLIWYTVPSFVLF